MNRKSFVESVGATCLNWTWSWSFVNVAEKLVVFGAWDINLDGDNALILSETWERDESGRKRPGYGQAVDHIKLVEDENYSLKIFLMEHSSANQNELGIGPGKIAGFEPALLDRSLRKAGKSWYAASHEQSPLAVEEIGNPGKYVEGASKMISVNSYERSAAARIKCLEHHGSDCMACGFSFEKMYGELEKGYIHVHHVVPLSEIGHQYELDPINDLVPVCPNCHAIIHRYKPALSIEELKDQLASVRSGTVQSESNK